MVRATRVAVATAGTRGTMNDLSRPVSSIIKTTVEIGPCVVAARTAAAPSTANSPGGTPGQNQDQAWPSTAPSNAPTVSEGVNKPRSAAAHAQHGRHRPQGKQDQQQRWRHLVGEGELRDISAVAKQLRERDRYGAKQPKTSTGAASRRQPSGLFRSAQVTPRT